jgi:ketosteroid isomerase-like protein
MTQTAPETSDPLLTSRNTWTEGMKSADVRMIGSVFCDDVVMMPPNETSLYGKDEAMEWYQEYYEYFRMTVLNGTERDIRIIGDQAIELWTYMVAIDPVHGGDRIRDDGRSLTVWRREQDGIWRVAETIWNSIRPIGSGTSRYLARLKKQ